MQELTLHTVLDRVIRGWRTLVVMGGIGIVAATATLPMQRPVFAVTMTVVPAPDEQNSNMGATSGAMSTLLSFAGGGAAGANSNYMRYQKLLSSTVVAQRMEDRHGMLRYVFASNWDKREQKWVPSVTWRSILLGWLMKLGHVPTWSPPDATTLASFLESQLIIVPSTQTDIVTVTMNDANVAFAKRVMLTANEQANAVLREQVARRARQQVAYLQTKLAQTTVADYRATLLQILSAQEKTLMLTQTDASFAAEILSPPMASPTPVSPRPVLSVFVAALASTLIGTMIVIFWGPDWWRNVREALRRLRSTRTRLRLPQQS